MTIRTASILALCIVPAMLGPSASADPNNGIITGHVRDANNKPVIGAEVKIVNTGEITKTDSSGDYHFTGEYPGMTVLRVSSPKYQAETLQSVVNTDRTTQLDFQLNADSVITVKGVNRNSSSDAHVVTVFIGARPKGRSEEPFANSPQETFPGDSGLHSTARSR